MKKIIISTILIIFISCSSATVGNKENILLNFLKTKKELITVMKNNDKQNIDKFFVKRLKTNIIVNKLKEIDLSRIDLYIPEKEIEIKNSNKIITLVILNRGIISEYFYVNWIDEDGNWKISDIYEK